MALERKPAAFGDMRRWIEALRAAGELNEVKALVDWDVELGTIVRVAQGEGDGPALLFSNIKDYNKPDSRGRRVFAGSMSSYRRMALVFGMDPDTHPRELVKLARNIMTGTLPPQIVKTGPVTLPLPAPAPPSGLEPTSMMESLSTRFSPSVPSPVPVLAVTV